MAAPTPVYPSWLTPVPITTEVDGVSVVETSIKYLPLTYFGPSIPLGSAFTFGGLTSSSSTEPTISLSPSTSLSSSQSHTTILSTSTTISSSTTASPSSTSTDSASAGSIQPIVAAANSHGLSIGTKLAIGLPIGLVALLLLILVLLYLRHRKRLRQSNRFSESNWQMMGFGGGVPREGVVKTGETDVLLPEEGFMRRHSPLSSNPILAQWMRPSYQPLAVASSESRPRYHDNHVASGTKTLPSRVNTTRSTTAPTLSTFTTEKHKSGIARFSKDSSQLARGLSPFNENQDHARLPPGASPPALPGPYGQFRFLSADNDRFIPPETTFDITSPSGHRPDSTESERDDSDELATLLTAQRMDLGPQLSISSASRSQRNRSLTSGYLESSNFGSAYIGTTEQV